MSSCFSCIAVGPREWEIWLVQSTQMFLEEAHGLFLLPPVNSLAEISLKIRGEDTATNVHTQAYRTMNIPREIAQSKFFVCHVNKQIINIQRLLVRFVC